VETQGIRVRMVGLLNHIDVSLASRVAQGLGCAVPKTLTLPLNMSVPADANPDDYQPSPVPKSVGMSAALSMANQRSDGIKTRKIAILAADGVDETALNAIQKALVKAGAQSKIIAPRGGTLTGRAGSELQIDHSLLTTSSVLFDAVYIPGGAKSVAALLSEAQATHFINEAYKHCKTIAATDEGRELVEASHAGANPVGEQEKDPGIVLGAGTKMTNIAAEFMEAIARHRHWSREKNPSGPA